MAKDRSGTTLGSYRLEKLLGEGGMGEVYVAVDEKLGRTVAIKVLRPEVVADPEHRTRFEREAKALAALNHPGIVTIYALEEADDVTFFVMDLVEGRTLTKIIKESGGLSVPRILDLAIPIADALAAALRRLLAEPGIARRMGAAGRLRAETRFSLEAMVARYEDLYLGLIRKDRTLAPPVRPERDPSAAVPADVAARPVSAR